MMAVRRSLGFTLIEMLVVMAIVALLLTLALPRYFGALERSRETVLRENLRVLRISIDRFAADRGRLPLNLDELVESQYLRTIPVDPITESSRTWVLVAPRNGQSRGVSDVRSGSPESSREGSPYAAF